MMTSYTFAMRDLSLHSDKNQLRSSNPYPIQRLPRGSQRSGKRRVCQAKQSAVSRLAAPFSAFAEKTSPLRASCVTSRCFPLPCDPRGLYLLMVRRLSRSVAGVRRRVEAVVAQVGGLGE